MTPDQIRQLRLDAGLTQAELARILKVSRQTVALWESGQRRPGQFVQPVLEQLRRQVDRAQRHEQVEALMDTLTKGVVLFGLGWLLASLFKDLADVLTDDDIPS